MCHRAERNAHPRSRRDAVPRPPRRRRGARARPRRDAVQPRPDAARSSSPTSRSCAATATATSTRSRGRSFDAVVDTSGYVPRIVRETLDALGDVGHYTFVSSISVYADLATPPTEHVAGRASSSEPTEEWREAYGELKARLRGRRPRALSRRVHPAARPDRRPVGPDRALHLLAAADRRRAAACSRRRRPTRRAGDRRARPRRRGSCAPPRTASPARSTPSTGRRPARACSRPAARVAGSDAELVWVDGDFLAEHEVGEWMELPLWLHAPEYAGMLSVDPRAGVRRRASRRARSRRRCATRSPGRRAATRPPTHPAGLAREKEQQVLDAWLSKE